jgi:hypothetical protein
MIEKQVSISEALATVAILGQAPSFLCGEMAFGSRIYATTRYILLFAVLGLHQTLSPTSANLFEKLKIRAVQEFGAVNVSHRLRDADRWRPRSSVCSASGTV